MRELCDEAVSAALAAGASYADARVVQRRSQSVATRNQRVDRLDDVESEGIGVRVLVDGAWGFACDNGLSTERARATAERASAFARAAPGGHDRALAPVEPVQGEYHTQVEQDPFALSLADKVEQCLRAEQAMQHDDVKVTAAFARAMREQKLFVSSDGAAIEQEMVECGAGIDAMAAREGITQIRSYPSAHGGSSAQAGWEYVESLGLEREAPRVGEQAAALLQADPCPAGIMTRRDRLGADGAAGARVGRPPDGARPRLRHRGGLAGTSSSQAARPRHAPLRLEPMNVTADSTTPGGLGTFG